MALGKPRSTCPGFGQYSVSIDAGVGEITVYIPAGLDVRMQLDTGLGETTISGEFIHQNGAYFTEGFDGAENYVEMTIDGGVGQITVIQQD